MHGEGCYPLTDFATHTNDHITRLDSLEAVAAVKESMAEYARGEGVSAREGLNSLREKHGIPRNT